MNYDTSIRINQRTITLDSPSYFIADIASNHDGDFKRAKKLIRIAKYAGADAVKFQHFLATDIVSDYGFKHLDANASHQNKWQKPVFEVYRDNECPREWTHELAVYAKKQNIDFFSTPYDYAAADLLAMYAPAFKIGSGDICWTDFLEYVARKEKPVILSTGASSLNDVQRAVIAVVRHNPRIALLQCNTNYSGNPVNLKYCNLNVLKQYARLYPGMVLGLSDHSPGHLAVLGAISLGARIIEKHFTDDCGRTGPDHEFSMDPESWKEMVENSRELESALGDGDKKIEHNEKESYIVQRRCMRVKRDLHAGELVGRDMIEALRPCPPGSIQPVDMEKVLCKKLRIEKKAGEALYFSDFGE
jgi:N-acetylneuraminate synthase